LKIRFAIFIQQHFIKIHVSIFAKNLFFFEPALSIISASFNFDMPFSTVLSVILILDAISRAELSGSS
jgi:hypothetical protein